MRCHVIYRGVIDFQEGVRIQNECFHAVNASGNEAALILCQHTPVITLGRRAQENNILFPAESLLKKGIAVVHTDRGGDVTYHGPGQLVAYPVVPLQGTDRDIHRYLRNLEEVILLFCAAFGLQAHCRSGLTGVWVQDKKIASIGISFKRWVSLHGLSITIEERGLEGYRFIRPCGMDTAMTSLSSEKGSQVSVADTLEVFLNSFRQVFAVTYSQEEALLWQS